MIYFNSHVRLYRKLKKESLIQETKQAPKPERQVADILEEVAQRAAYIKGYKPNDVVVECTIEGVGTIMHRGGDRVVFGRDW